MKKGIFTFLIGTVLALSASTASARIWRVNNNAGVNADFTDLPAAVTGASAGDTIYLESSATSYTGVTNLAKRLVIIGTGYYLSGTHLNPNTQANPNPSTISNLYLIAGSSGSVVEGITFTSSVILSDDKITLERNNLNTVYVGYTSNSNNDTIRQNFLVSLNAYSSSFGGTNMFIYNNIFVYGINFTASINNYSGYIINNAIGSVTYGTGLLNVSNFTLQNNILFAPSLGVTAASNVYFNNIVSTSSATSGIPTGNANVFNVTDFTTVFVGWGAASSGFSPDGAYVLKAGSPAIGAGALNGSTVDCGVFGGGAPYVLSGMPSIPSIYVLTAPSQVNAGTATVNVTISSISN